MKNKLFTTRIKPINALVGVLAFSVFGVFLYWALGGGGSDGLPSISTDQIKIQKGEKTVIVNENGVIEYYSKSGVYYDYWDEGRTKSFFEFVRQKAREYLSAPPKEENADGYYITLYLDGREVKIWVSGDEEIINEMFEADPTDLGTGSGSLDEYFDEYFNPSPTGTGGGVEVDSLTPTLVPGPGVVSAQDGQTPSGGGSGGSERQIPADCSLFEATVTGRTIISNALCVDPKTINPQ